MGEAAHPGPSGEGIDVADWSSSDEEDLVEAQREKRRNKRGQQRHEVFARARKAVRKSRAKKVGHVVALKNSFFQGLKGDEPQCAIGAPLPFVVAGVALSARQVPFVWQACYFQYLRRCPRKRDA